MASIERLLDRTEKVYRVFRGELLLYNIGSIGALALVCYAAFATLYANPLDPKPLGSFIGSGGVFAATGLLTTRFLNKQTDLLSRIIDSFFALVGRHD